MVWMARRVVSEDKISVSSVEERILCWGGAAEKTCSSDDWRGRRDVMGLR